MRILRRSLLFLSLLIYFLPLSAEIYEPAKWSFSSEKLDEQTYVLHFDVTIDEGWYVYSQFIDEGGPIPTSFHFADSSTIELLGSLTEKGDKTVEGEDPIFMMPVKKFAKHVRFQQKIKLRSGATVQGFLEFMACDDEKCLPPAQIDFQFELGGDDNAATTEQDMGLDNNTFGITGIEDEEAEGTLLKPVKWSLSREMLSEGKYRLTFDAAIDEGWFMYAQQVPEGGPIPTSFTFEEIEGLTWLNDMTEEGAKEKEGYDPFFDMEVKKFGKHATFTRDLQITSADAVIKGSFEFMVCDDTRCLAPEWVDFSIDLATNEAIVGDDTPIAPIDTGDCYGKFGCPINECGVADAEQAGNSIFSIFLLGILGGFIALLTPCVFPMIPLTVSFFTKSSQKPGKGMADALFYGFCIVLIYFLLSVPFLIFDISPDALNELSTNALLNLLFFVIFVVFAISFFGFFEITLPHAIANRADSASNVGGLIGIFFMALTLAIVSFSCTGPILGTLLVGSLTAAGGQYNLVAGMVGFGLALALPFGLFAAFPQWLNKLPKSGGWLNSVKVVLGFIELALALKFLSNADLVQHWGLIKREVFLIIWILLGLGLAAYLFGIIRFPHDSKKLKGFSVGRMAFIVAVLAFVVYLIPGLFGANLKLLSGFPPPMFYSLQKQDSNCPLGIQCFKDYEEGMAYAKANNKPVMLDFTGWACVNCRKMEENVWVEDKIYAKLNNDFVLISLYVDDRKPLPEEEQQALGFGGKRLRTVGNKWSYFQASNFKNNSQPWYVLLSPDEKILTEPVGYTPDAEEYLSFLDCGLSAMQTGRAQAGLVR